MEFRPYINSYFSPSLVLVTRVVGCMAVCVRLGEHAFIQVDSAIPQFPSPVNYVKYLKEPMAGS